MKLSMRRIVLFTKDMAGMIGFYRDVLGPAAGQGRAGLEGVRRQWLH